MKKVKKIPKQEYTAEFKEQAVKHAQAVGIVVSVTGERFRLGTLKPTGSTCRQAQAHCRYWRTPSGKFLGPEMHQVGEHLLCDFSQAERGPPGPISARP